MDLASNTILLTGGATGIGLALAQRLQAAGSQVIAVGRRADKLRAAQQQVPGLLTYQADLAQPTERVAMAEWVRREHPGLNVLFNNAGIFNQVAIQQLGTSLQAWEQERQELAINLEAPIHLSALLLPQLQGKAGATILNVSSGLAFVPLAAAPIYCATKAALHSFTRSLRHQAARLGVAVVELVPPQVQTDLGGPGQYTGGESVDVFADAVLARIAAGELEIGYGIGETLRLASHQELDAYFQQMNK
ncbi:MAG: SDR family NAD(P)-dependent oxidoreductase [Hymenobacter sp.]|nr:MAG: SDR family NAD(P)-dependent oxidoreductase [Hymenobacter sp.]